MALSGFRRACDVPVQRGPDDAGHTAQRTAAGECGEQYLYGPQITATKGVQFDTQQNRKIIQNRLALVGCESACNKDPVFGVIGIQSGPRDGGSTVASMGDMG